MAKESMKAREVKRAKLVAKYAAKRAALKEAGDYAALDKPTAAPSPVVPRVICVTSASAVSSSAKWPPRA